MGMFSITGGLREVSEVEEIRETRERWEELEARRALALGTVLPALEDAFRRIACRPRTLQTTIEAVRVQRELGDEFLTVEDIIEADGIVLVAAAQDAIDG